MTAGWSFFLFSFLFLFLKKRFFSSVDILPLCVCVCLCVCCAYEIRLWGSPSATHHLFFQTESQLHLELTGWLDRPASSGLPVAILSELRRPSPPHLFYKGTGGRNSLFSQSVMPHGTRWLFVWFCVGFWGIFFCLFVLLCALKRQD